MTVSSATSRKTFSGDNATTSFGTSPIVFFETDNLLVYVITDSTGAVTVLTEDSDYSVSGGDGSTGTVDLSGGSDPWGALQSGTTLVILRELPVVQEFDPEQNDGSDAEALEDAIDRVVMIQQQVNEALGRSLRVPVSESEQTEITVAGLAGYYLRRNAAGTAWELAAGDQNDTSYTASGTGAIERSVTSKLGDVIDAADFATLQQAITAAEGKTLRGHGVSYTVATALNFPSNIVVEGVNFVGNEATANLMTTTSKSNITFRDCKFSSAGTYSAVSTFTLCTNVSFYNCTFDMLRGSSLNSITLRFYGTVGVKIRDCRFYDADSNIYLDLSGGTYSDRVEVLNCYFEQTVDGASNNPTGIYQYNCKRLLVDGCTFKNIRANGGAPIAGYSVYEGDGTTESLIVTNCTTVMDHGGSALAHVMVQNSNAAHCCVESNRLFARAMGATGNSYFYNGGATRGHVQILGNYIERAAILVTGGATAATGVRTALVQDNIIYKCEQNTASIRIGVTGANYVDYASVKDNTCYNGYAGSINISETNFAVVEGNRCMNWNSLNNGTPTNYAYTAAIYWLGTVKTGFITNNRIENNSYVGGDVGYPQYAIAIDASNTILAEKNNIVGTMTGGNYVNIKPYTTELTTWTPTLGGNATYTDRTAYYVKNGQMITAWFDITVNAIGTGSASDIDGLPYTAAITTSADIGFSSGLAVTPVSISCYTTGTIARIVGRTAAAAAVTNPLNALGNGARVVSCITYPIAA